MWQALTVYSNPRFEKLDATISYYFSICQKPKQKTCFRWLVHFTIDSKKNQSTKKIITKVDPVNVPFNWVSPKWRMLSPTPWQFFCGQSDAHLWGGSEVTVASCFNMP
jgi:hypothetical protein